MAQPQQHRIWAMSATYTTAQGHARSLTHWVRPGMEPVSSWTLVGFVSAAPLWEFPILWFSNMNDHNPNHIEPRSGKSGYLIHEEVLVCWELTESASGLRLVLFFILFYFIFFLLFSHCTARGSGYPYMYTLQLQFSPHPFFCCNHLVNMFCMHCIVFLLKAESVANVKTLGGFT